jgi:hypothetical protein
MSRDIIAEAYFACVLRAKRLERRRHGRLLDWCALAPYIGAGPAPEKRAGAVPPAGRAALVDNGSADRLDGLSQIGAGIGRRMGHDGNTAFGGEGFDDRGHFGGW